jgi:hypothetical protein
MTADSPETDEEYSDPRLGVRPYRVRVIHPAWPLPRIFYHLEVWWDMPARKFLDLIEWGWAPIYPDDEDEYGPVRMRETIILCTTDEAVAYDTFDGWAEEWAETPLYEARN